MSRATKHVLFIAFAGAALLGGCGDDSSSDDGGGGSGGGGSGINLPDPCAVVSEASLEPIVGDIAGKEAVTSSNPGCVWYDANDDSLLTTELFATSSAYDAGKTVAGVKTISGVGAEAYLSTAASVWVKMPNGVSIFAQSLVPVSDEQVSAQIETATAGKTEEEVLMYEASYRLAKVVAGEL